jgi:hypothetical protein
MPRPPDAGQFLPNASCWLSKSCATTEGSSAMPRDDSGLTIIPHEWAGGKNCCGFLKIIERDTEADLVCNECGELKTTVAIADVEKALAQFLAQQDFCTARCPHCDAVNMFPGFDRSVCLLGVLRRHFGWEGGSVTRSVAMERRPAEDYWNRPYHHRAVGFGAAASLCSDDV